MRRRTANAWLIGLVAIIGTCLADGAAAQNVSVTAANPPSGEQDTVGLVVKITGKNFAPGAHSDFFKSGTTDPAGISVRSTQFVSSTELNATIDIAATATLSFFDVKVTNTSGRSGKGSDLFNVVQKSGGQQACDADTIKLSPVTVLLNAAPGDAACQVGASGALDCGFGTGGRVTTAVRPPYGFAVNLAAQADGKLLALVKGYTPTSTSGYDIYVVRYNVNGSIDSTFGAGGTTRIGFTSQVDYENAVAIATQTDGKIVVAGNVPQKTAQKVGVARLNVDGSLDTSFGSAGKLLFSFGSDRVDSSVYDVRVQRDGRILVGGTTNQQFAVARLTATGGLDSTFGTSARVVLSVGQATTSYTTLFAIGFQDWSGQQYPILVGNSPTCVNSPPQMAVVRLTPDGSVDSTFGPAGTGQTFIDIGENYDYANGVAIDAANHIILAGTTFSHTAVVRLLPDGTLDEGFGTGGATVLDVSGKLQTLTLRVALDSVGRVVIGGYTTPATGSDWSFLVARLLADGTPDVTFGGSGAVVTDFGIGLGQDWARGLVIQPSGRIVLAGVATPSYVGLSAYTP